MAVTDKIRVGGGVRQQGSENEPFSRQDTKWRDEEILYAGAVLT